MSAIIKFIARVIIGLLWLRFVVKLFSLAATGLVATLYHWTSYLIYPFRGIFRDIVLVGHLTIESTTLLAIVVYAFVEFILVRLLGAAHHDDY